MLVAKNIFTDFIYSMMRINFYNNNQTPTFNARRLSAAKPEIEALLRQGKTPKDIAAAYKHNPSWGNWIIKRFELEPLRNQIKEDVENQIIALRKDGATIKTIVEIVNLSTKKVTDIITKSGVKKPRKTAFQKGNINLERNNIIKAELAKGFTIKEVAKNTGYSAYIVKNLVKDLDKNELKIAKEQLKLERTTELANSVYDDLKISGNVQDIIENNEKLKISLLEGGFPSFDNLFNFLLIALKTIIYPKSVFINYDDNKNIWSYGENIRIIAKEQIFE